MGADPASQARYIRARGEGECVGGAAFADAHIIRPAVMFGPDDAFLTTILTLLRRLPIYPLFGRGLMSLQPAYVEDVAEAIVRIIERAEAQPGIFECGGPRVYSYEEFVGIVARQAGLAPIPIPIPFAVWHALACISLFPSREDGCSRASPATSTTTRWRQTVRPLPRSYSTLPISGGAPFGSGARKTGRPWSGSSGWQTTGSRNRESFIRGQRVASPLDIQSGKLCPNWARTDLCGGREVTPVPTAKRIRRLSKRRILIQLGHCSRLHARIACSG